MNIRLGSTGARLGRRRRRAMASMLAMIYLVLFATMAIGFYAATNTSMHVSHNDEEVSRAFMASESGMDFMRFKLAHVALPADPAELPNTIDHLFSDLSSLNDTKNLSGYTIAKDGPNTIRIPGDTNGFIKLDPSGNSGFRAVITFQGGSRVVVNTVGRFGSQVTTGRSITMDFERKQHENGIFDYAVASEGQIVITKGSVTSVAGVDPKIVTVMSALGSGVSVNVNALLGGDISYLNGATVSIGGGASVGGSTIPSVIMADHVKETSAPIFPSFDPTAYKPFATSTYVSGAKVQNNIRIPPGVNPKFNGNDTVNGIMYIESPNIVTFNGAFNLNGFIVMATGGANNALIFKGNLTMGVVPADPKFDDVRSTTSIAIMAPDAAVSFTGSSGGNVKGNIIVKSLNFAGASDLSIDQGSIMTLSANTNSFVMNGAKSVKFSSTGANNHPTLGLVYNPAFDPCPETYAEARQQ